VCSRASHRRKSDEAERLAQHLKSGVSPQNQTNAKSRDKRIDAHAEVWMRHTNTRTTAAAARRDRESRIFCSHFNRCGHVDSKLKHCAANQTGSARSLATKGLESGQIEI
jgi:hypothetical protein